MKTMNTIYTNFAKRFAVVLTLLLALEVTSAWAEDELAYTIIFKNSVNGNTQIQSTTKSSTVIAANCTTFVASQPFSNISKAYYGDNKTSIRIGTSSDPGTLDIALSNNGQVKATKVVVNCYLYNSGKPATLSLNGKTAQSIPTSAGDLTFDINADITSLSIAISKYAFVNTISVYKESAPSTFTVTCEVNEETPWGTLSSTDPISDLASGTSISAEGNVLTIGETEITAIPNEADAQYTYAFEEWTWEPAGATITSNVVATATFTRNERKLINYRTLCTYNIEYTNLEGTTHTNPATYNAADLSLTFTAPSAREGYTFKGWDPATLSAETRGDQTVTAQWAANTYSVIFNANGGTGTMENQQFTYDVEQALSANQFTRVGYTFAGWNDNASGNSTSYTDQEVVKNLSSAKNGQRTLYAQWTANTNTPYMVKHYKEQLDGTYLAEADDTDNLTGTTASSVTPAVKSYEGFTAPSTQTVSIAADGSTVVTYLYTRNSYKLTWDLAGGIITTEGTAEGSVKYEEPITAPTVAKFGYNFMSWSPEVPATMPAANVTCTAQWTANTYTITFDQQEATTPGTTTVEATYGSALPSIAENLPTKTGYNFGGYFTEPNGNGTQYYHGTGNGARTWDIASETILYAYWKPNTCILIFNMNGGVGEQQPNLTATYDQPMPALTAPLPTLSGFEFSGYFDEKTGGVMYYNAAGESARNWDKTNGEKTLYAQWAAIHTVTWMVNGNLAEGDPTTSVVNGQTITTLPTTPDVDCNGKVFVGWTTATIHGETATIPDPLYTELGAFPAVTSNMTFYAVFANGSGDELWVETEITKISSGDEVVISVIKYGSDDLPYTYALSHTNGTTSAPVASSLENIQNGILSQTPKQELVWTIEKDNANNLIFHPINDNTLNLYCNASDDGVRVGKSANALTNQKFIIYDNYLTNIVTTRFVGVSFNTNPYTWRCYEKTTGVISNQILKFYKKTTVYTSYTNYSTSCMAGVCDITNANPICVTSTVGQKIKATDKLVLTTTDMAIGTEISLSAPNITFYKEGVEITQLTTTAASETFELEIAYQPTIANTTEQPTITLEILGYQFAFNNKITGRSLPAKFVIATKAGATWYALPANMNGATNPAAVVIEVDETTMTATAPNTTPYTLYPVATVNGASDRYKEYGERLRFAAVNNGNKGLWANNSKEGTDINNYAAITAANSTAGAAYEWKVTTTIVDGNWQYTLYSDQENNKNHLCYSMNQTTPAWGTYASNEAQYHLYFLPIKAETTPFDYQVVEWYPNKVLIHTTTAFSSLTAKIAGEQVANVQYTAKDANQYEVTGLPLMKNPAKALTLEFVVADATHTGIHTIPVMLSGGKHSVSTLAIGKGIYNYTDLVVRDGATLTVDGSANTDNTFYDVTIYPTAKISVPEGKQLSVHRMTFLGGISEIYNGSTYTTNKYGVPQLSLKGTLGKTVTTMDYIMRVDLDQMYQVGVPYDVDLNDITYWDGSAIKLGDELYVSAYDGQARANLDMNNTWRWEVKFAEKVLKAGIGYTISAEPQVEGDTYSILRMPMKNNIASGTTEASKQVPVIAYANQHSVQIADNHKGWNYLSNPYMTAISGGDADSKILLGSLQYNDGSWELVNTEYRYVTIPHDDGEDYNQQKFFEAILLPFKSFFVQIAQGGELSFALASRQNAPARYMEVQTEQEVEFEILLSNDKQSDNTGLLIAEQYSPAYEINADLEKMIGSMSVYSIYNGYNLAYNAINPTNAQDWIPIGYSVPDVGEYTFSLDEDVDLESVEHIYLIDYETSEMTDLLEDVYTFYTSEKKNNLRFAIQVRLSQEHDNTTTGLDNLDVTDNKSSKFIYNEQLYILRNGNIYDATGQFVTTINK